MKKATIEHWAMHPLHSEQRREKGKVDNSDNAKDALAYSYYYCTYKYCYSSTRMQSVGIETDEQSGRAGREAGENSHKRMMQGRRRRQKREEGTDEDEGEGGRERERQRDERRARVRIKGTKGTKGIKDNRRTKTRKEE